jgi:Ice-binding-like
MSNIISGNVTVAGATVFCQPIPAQGSDGKGTLQQTTSALNGDYAFSGLISGTYRISAFLPGFVFPSRIVVISPTTVTEPAFLSTGYWALVSHSVIPSDQVGINFSPSVLGGGALPQTPISTQLGLAANYALLSAAGITNTGATLVSGGNIGSFPTATITGFTGANFTAPATTDNTNAAAARADALVAYNFYSGLTFSSLSGSSANLSVLGNSGTYFPGNYSAGSSMDIPTSITLNAQGNPNAAFVFKAGSTLTLESGASILLVNGAKASNVIWPVGSSLTTVGTTGVFNGNALINTSATLGGGTVNGRILAGVVTLTGAITIASATAVSVPTS